LAKLDARRRRSGILNEEKEAENQDRQCQCRVKKVECNRGER